jgi:hypothetical protein
MPDNYRRDEIRLVLDVGPEHEEDFFRLVVTGAATTKHLNVTPAEVAAVRDLLAGDVTVFVLNIDHKHGTNASVHRSAAGAKQALHEFAAEWWDDDGPGGLIPTDADAAIDAYFAHNERESYEITEAPLS